MSTTPLTIEATSVYNPQNPNNPLFSINMSNITRLTDSNYVMWSRQIKAQLEGHELHVFLDSTNTPSSQITVDGTLTTNPLFQSWHRQDRLLYSALIGTISLAVQPIVSSAVTTADVWKILADTYGFPTQGHIRQLKHHIKQCVKGTKSISEYLRTIKTKTDELALLRQPMHQDDLIEQILAGLGDEYKPEISAVNGRDKSVSFAELNERLLNRVRTTLASTTSLSNKIDSINTTLVLQITLVNLSLIWVDVKLVVYRDMVLSIVLCFVLFLVHSLSRLGRM